MKAWIPREMPPSSCFCLLNIWGPECELSARSLSSPILKTWACLLRIDVFYKIDWQINWSAESFAVLRQTVSGLSLICSCIVWVQGPGLNCLCLGSNPRKAYVLFATAARIKLIPLSCVYA